MVYDTENNRFITILKFTNQTLLQNMIQAYSLVSISHRF